MTAPRVLLLTRVTPGAASVGGVYLDELCSYYPQEAISCFALSSRDKVSGSDCNGISMVYGQLPRSWLYRGLGPTVRRGVRALSRRYIQLWQVPALANQIAAFAREQDVEMIWATLSPPVMVSIVKKVISILGIPLVTTIWDPPEMQMRMHGPAYDRRMRRRILLDFIDVLKMSDRCGVASYRMAEAYRELYGIDPVVMALGAGADLRHPPARKLHCDGRFVIGYAGGWRTPNEWDALFSALDACNWHIAGRDITVRLLSGHVTLKGEGNRHIEFLGWRSETQTVDILSQTDVGYVPYWFDDRYDLSVRLCFPGKVTTYMAAGIPIFYHGPRDSSVVDFLERFPAGLGCHSLDGPEIVESLRLLIEDREFYTHATQAGQAALDQDLSMSVFRKRFATLLGVEEDDLRPGEAVSEPRGVDVDDKRSVT